MEKAEKKILLVCEVGRGGNLKNCHTEPEKQCETVKETGAGIHGPIFNIKRVCPVGKPSEILTNW